MSQTHDQLRNQLSRILDEDGPEGVEVGDDAITVRTYPLKTPTVQLLAEDAGAEHIETREDIDHDAGEELVEVVVK